MHPALEAESGTRTPGERAADRIAAFGGSWPFIIIFLGALIIWMIVNTVVIGRLMHARAFDPYPYILLNLCLSCVAAIQAPIIMMSQNRAAKRDSALASHHYDETRLLHEINEHQLEILARLDGRSREAPGGQ